jgi:hypothetical protein
MCATLDLSGQSKARLEAGARPGSITMQAGASFSSFSWFASVKLHVAPLDS